MRGGLALVFAGLLQIAADLFGTIFFDPVMLVFLALLLGFYIFASGIVLAVAAGFTKEHHLDVWKYLSADAIFALALGTVIAVSLFMTSSTLGLLAGIHALGVGVFQLAMAIRLRYDRLSTRLLSVASMISLGAGYLFLTHGSQPIGNTTHWLASFELLFATVTLALAWRLHGRGSPSYLPASFSPSNTPSLEGAL